MATASLKDDQKSKDVKTQDGIFVDESCLNYIDGMETRKLQDVVDPPIRSDDDHDVTNRESESLKYANVSIFFDDCENLEPLESDTEGLNLQITAVCTDAKARRRVFLLFFSYIIIVGR